MEFPRIASALVTCRKHIASLNDADAAVAVEIESHLVAAMTLLIVSEYEAFIEGAFCRRAERCGDLHVTNYVRSQLSQRFRSPRIGKVSEALGHFGKDYKETFLMDVENTPKSAAWDNIINARHAIVHGSGTMNLTFRELEESYNQTKTVIEKLLRTLGL